MYPKKAIVTRYHSPSNVRGSRISASTADQRITIHIDNGLQTEDQHRTTAQKLADKYNWKGTLVEGVLPNGDHVFVFAE